MPPVAPTPTTPTPPTTPPEEEKKEEEKTIQYKDTSGSGPKFIFGMAGHGNIEEGADAAVGQEQQKALLKKLVKKLGTPTPPPGATPPPTK